MAYQAQVSFPYFSGIPADVVVNTWHFTWGNITSPSPTDFTALRTLLQDFYATVFTASATNSMAPWVSPGATNFKVFDLTDPIPRAPQFESTSSWPVTQATTAVAPPEVAICMSYQGARISGLPQARRRGRVFIGALGGCTTAGGTNAFPIPTAQLLAAVANAGSGLLADSALTDWQWVVWSRADQLGVLVTDGWVDNAFDTQRRRGNAATARSLFS